MSERRNPQWPASTNDTAVHSSVPAGYGQLLGKPMPNIEETQDLKKVLTAAFNGGAEVW